MIVFFVILSAISSLFGLSRLVNKSGKVETQSTQENRRVGGMLGIIGGGLGILTSVLFSLFRRKKKPTTQQKITSDIRSRIDELKQRLEKNKKKGFFDNFRK